MTATTLPSANVITPLDFQRLLDEDPNVRVLDVRTGSEYTNGHIEGSYHVPLDTLGEHVVDLANVNRTIVLVCQSGARAASAHTQLAAAGHSRLQILEGGMNAWEAAGGDVVRGTTQRWAMERQVRLVAGGLVASSIAASVFVPGARFLAGAIGAGLTYSAVSNTCTMANVLAKLPYNKTDTTDVATVINQLRSET